MHPHFLNNKKSFNSNGDNMKKSKQKLVIIAFIFLIIAPIFFTTTNAFSRFGIGKIYGYVRNGKGARINGVLVEAYVGSFKEDQDVTDAYGRYDIDIGLISSKTYVTLKFTPSGNYKAKQISTSVYPGETKRKDATLTQFLALIIAGSSEERYNIDAIFMQETLIDHYNFDSSGNNIYLLSVFNLPERDREATVDNVNWAIGEIASKSSSIDQVLVFILSHGSTNWIKIGFEWEGMSAGELDNSLDTIICKYMYIFINTCKSGSCIPYLNDNDNRAIYTSSDASHLTSEGYFTWWGHNVVASLIPGTGEYELAEEADTNSNSKVSLYEMYVWAKSVIDEMYPSQNPLRWFGSALGSGDFPDTNHYLGDESYTN